MKNSARKILSIVLCLAMMLSMVPAAFASDAAAEPTTVTYTFNSATGNTDEAAGGLWTMVEGSNAANTSVLPNTIHSSGKIGGGFAMRIYIPAAGEYEFTLTRWMSYQAGVSLYIGGPDVTAWPNLSGDLTLLGALSYANSGNTFSDNLMPNTYTVPEAGWYTIVLAVGTAYDYFTMRSVTISPKVWPVETITLDKDIITAEAGEEITINATVGPDNATNKSLTWTSSDNNVATVENGVVKAVSNGVAKITAASVTNPEVTAECAITVGASYVPVSSITLDKTEAYVDCDDSITISATVNPADATDTDVIWSTSNASVATVENGVVYGAGKGTATITATSAANDEISASCVVTVDFPALPESDFPVHRTFKYDLANTYDGAASVDKVYGKRNSVESGEWGFPSLAYPAAKDVQYLSWNDTFIIDSLGGKLGDYGQTATVMVYVPVAGRYKINFNAIQDNKYSSAMDIYVCPLGVGMFQPADYYGKMPQGEKEGDYTYSPDRYISVMNPGYYNIGFRSLEKGNPEAGNRVYLNDITFEKISEVPATTDVSIPLNSGTAGASWEFVGANYYSLVYESGIMVAHDSGRSAYVNGTEYVTVKLSGIPAGDYVAAVTTYRADQYDNAIVHVFGGNECGNGDLQFNGLGTHIGSSIAMEPASGMVVSPLMNDIITVDESGEYYLSFYGNYSDWRYRFFVAGIALSPDYTPAESISISEEVAEVEKDALYTLTAEIGPEEATDKVVAWKTSDDSVAIVSEGVVKAVGYGTATITAYVIDNPEISASCVVTVPTPAVAGIELDLAELAMEVEETATLTATILPEGAVGEIVWTTDADDVATVENGVVTAVGAGTATITATLGDFTASCVVTVTGGEPEYDQGDVNGDGKLNTRDVTTLRRYLAGGYEDSITYVEAMIDVNGDGRENTRDVAALRAIIAG